MKAGLVAAAQKSLRWLAGEYKVFVILARSLENRPAAADAGPLQVIATPDTPNTGGYAGPDAYGLAYVEQGRPVCTCWVWFGRRYLQRNFWPLAARDCKLIALATEEAARGRGLAPQVIEFAAQTLARVGFERMYARVWHSNRASLRSFAKAGWSRHAVVVELYPAGLAVRIVLPLEKSAWRRAGLRVGRRTSDAAAS